jgi:biotin operon repressor
MKHLCNERRAVLTQQATYANSDGGSIKVSAETVGKALGISRWTVQRRLTELKALGFLKDGERDTFYKTKNRTIDITAVVAAGVKSHGADTTKPPVANKKPHGADRQPHGADTQEQVVQIAQAHGADRQPHGADSLTLTTVPVPSPKPSEPSQDRCGRAGVLGITSGSAALLTQPPTLDGGIVTETVSQTGRWKVTRLHTGKASVEPSGASVEPSGLSGVRQ